MSSYKEPNLMTGLKAGADLSALNYPAVKLDASGDVVQAVAGEKAIGFLQNKPTSGQYAEVGIVGGGALAKAGGTLAAGNYLKSDANSDVVVSALNGDNVIGIAMEAAVVGDYFSVLPMIFTNHA